MTKDKKCKHEFRQKLIWTAYGMKEDGYYCIHCLETKAEEEVEEMNATKK